jgi:hypothetical protein
MTDAEIQDVARAIYVAFGGQNPADDDLTKVEMAGTYDLVDAARAAISALPTPKEPTP